MPIYEYTCQDCGSRFDALRSMKDADAPIQCKSCSGTHTQRAISVFIAQSNGRAVAGTSQCNCSGCAGGSCSSCNN